MPAIDRITGLTASIAYKAPCRVATDAQITLSGLQTIDGVALAEDDRVLVAGQTDASENGIYIASPNDWKRAADFDDNRDATNGTQVFVSDGSRLAGDWVVSFTGQFVLGTTNIDLSFPITLRPRLLSDRTYYVSPSGNDSFAGTSSLFPFKTIQKAVDTAYTLDWNGYNVTIQLADGTYTAGVVASGRFVGLTTYNGGLTIKGNAATPSNVQVIPATSSYSFNADKGANLIIKDLYVANPNGGICLLATQSGTIYFGNLEFGQSAYTHCEATQWGFINAISNYKISGGAVGHLHCPQGGQIWVNNINVTLVGTPNFTTFFVGVAGPGECHAMSFTFTGSATGPRFLVHSAGTIFMNAAANLNYFPGSIAGTIDDQTFGVYDYKPQTTFPTLTGNNSFTARMAVNGAQINGMLNVATGADNTMRWTDGAGGPEMTAVNQLQNGFKVMFLRASDFQLMVSGNGTPTLRVLNGAVGVNNSGMNSPLQVAVNSTDTMRWTTTTNGSEMSAVNQAQSAFRIMSLRGNEVRMYGDANTTPTVHVTATGLGFNNSAPIAKPTITGSRGGNAALASLLTALASYGLITDSTTA